MPTDLVLVVLGGVPLRIEASSPFPMAVGAVVELFRELGQPMSLDDVGPPDPGRRLCHRLGGIAEVEHRRLALVPGSADRVLLRF
ncbi:MAG: hypothetical protein M3Y71_18510 [Actinomycetota bacterium]|nr:hypothetical protein [Actinomycetota bacterium]